MTPRILVFAGSTRKGSVNKKLARLVALAVKKAGGEATLVDLADLPMPLYDGDLEEEKGLPESAKKLKELFLAHHGLALACPEYNSSISGVLKNAIDWVSREETDDEPELAAYKDKTCALFSASPGALGGMRGLITVRSILGNIGVTVIPDQLAVGKAYDAFDEAGHLKDPKQQGRLEKIAAKLVSVTGKLRG